MTWVLMGELERRSGVSLMGDGRCKGEHLRQGGATARYGRQHCGRNGKNEKLTVPIGRTAVRM